MSTDMRTWLESQVTVSEEALSQGIGDEAVILDLKSGKYFGLDETGARVWQLIQEHKQLQQIIDIMLDEYDVGAQQLGEDISRLLADLEESGLVTIKR